MSSRLADREVVRGAWAPRRAAGLGRLASADGVRLRLPPGFATEVLARELGLRHNYLSPDDAWSAAASSP